MSVGNNWSQEPFDGDKARIPLSNLAPLTACPDCGVTTRQWQRFCHNCGYQMPHPVGAAPGPTQSAPYACGRCGTAVFTGQRFCAWCDLDLSTPQTAPWQAMAPGAGSREPGGFDQPAPTSTVNNSYPTQRPTQQFAPPAAPPQYNAMPGASPTQYNLAPAVYQQAQPPTVPFAYPATPQVNNYYNYQQVVVYNPKNVALAVLLAFLFGPFGMFYSTVSGALIILALTLPVACVTGGLGLFLLWPVCMIWAGVAAASSNQPRTR